MTAGRVEVAAADIARIADVKPTAVSNWRKRHGDFPKPVGGTDRSPRFDLAEVEAWLAKEGKAGQVAAAEKLWQAFESAREVMSSEAALALTGLLLFQLRQDPAKEVPGDKAGFTRVMERAKHTFVQAPGGDVGGLGELLLSLQYDLGARQLSLLAAAAGTAVADGAAAAFNQLCDRFLGQGARTGFAATPPELADLMITLAGDVSGTVVDPACGSGTFLLSAADRGCRRVQGQDVNPAIALVAALRLALRNTDSVKPSVAFDIRAQNSLLHPGFPRGRAAAVVGHPPFAARTWGYEELEDGADWEYGFPSRMESELAWVQRALSYVAPGKPVVLLLPPGVAFRSSGRRIRAELLRRGALRAVISLPTGFAAHYALSLQIWVLERPVAGAPMRDEVLLVDTGEVMRVSEQGEQIRALVTELWSDFTSAPHGFAERPGVARAISVMTLLDEETDLTPRRHLPLPVRHDTSATALNSARMAFEDALRVVKQAVPPMPDIPAPDSPGMRTVTLNELAKSGVVMLRRPLSTTPRTTGVGSGSARYLTSRDISLGRGPSQTGPVPDDVLENPPIRQGDVLVPMFVKTPIARVATEDDAGTYLDVGIHLIRTNSDILNPWYLAGYLSSTDGGRQAMSVTSSSGTSNRIEPRRVRILLLPVELQETYGSAFRRLAEFTRTLRTAHDLGRELARNSADAIAVVLSSVADGVGVQASSSRR
ncbi:N-6 DNA methylase [Lentzea sp. NPDC003310]|uniref:N-6 DNA methylase n=1 Tax=Lentzea sp. NPDC003310 TaxID=3154447 RepID=UPI0033B40EB5